MTASRAEYEANRDEVTFRDTEQSRLRWAGLYLWQAAYEYHQHHHHREFLSSCSDEVCSARLAKVEAVKSDREARERGQILDSRENF